MQNSCGIVAIDCSIAEKIITSKEIALLSGFNTEYIEKKLGFEQKRIALPTQKPSDFAIQAAQGVLKKTDVMANELDFLIYCSSGMYDYQFWSPSAYIQKIIGANKAISFEINNGCNASNIGLLISCNLLKTENNWKYGLIIISDTLSKFVDYSDKSSFPLFSLSDGAAAALISANHTDNVLLGHSFHTDGDYANCCKIEPSIGRHSSLAQNNTYIKMDAPEKIAQLRENLMADNYTKVIQETMRNANIEHNTLSHILTNQNSQSIIDRVLQLLSINPDKHHKTSQYYGHIGGVDTFFGLYQLLENKIARKDNLVLMATAGIGFHWGAHVIKV